jgi:hypothetical protein
MGKIIAGYSLVALASVGCGAYVGYCNAKGLPVEHEFALKYGSTIAHGVVGAPILATGLVAYAFDALNNLGSNKKDPLKKVGSGTSGDLGIFMLLGWGTIIPSLGALETAVGYGIGYAAGKVS